MSAGTSARNLDNHPVAPVGFGAMQLPGTSSRAHLEENVAAGSLDLDAEAMERLG